MLYKILNKLIHWFQKERIKRNQKLFKSCGKNVSIDNNVIIFPNEGLSIGDNSVINGYTFIFCGDNVSIGKNCMISANCILTAVSHHNDSLTRISEEGFQKAIIMGDNVWIGAGAIILPGINIGNNSIVGAGSVVTKSIPENEIWAGNPARFVKKIIITN